MSTYWNFFPVESPGSKSPPPSLGLGSWLTLSLDHTQESFPCPHCDRIFPSTQALGGHQNAHRKEFLQNYGDDYQKREKNIYHNHVVMGGVLRPKPLKVLPLLPTNAIPLRLSSNGQNPRGFQVNQHGEITYHEYMNRRFHEECQIARRRSMGRWLTLGYDYEETSDPSTGMVMNPVGMDVIREGDENEATSKHKVDLTLSL